MAFAVDKLDQWVEGPDFTVEADRVIAYAEATNDPIPAHRAGEVAPPVFAVVPIWETLTVAMAQVTPPEALAFVVHGEQDMHFHRPIRPGMLLRSQAAPIGVAVKPNGTTVVVKVRTTDAEGTPVVEQYMTSFFRGISDGTSAGAEAPPHKLDADVRASAPVATVDQQIDPDQTFRYAKASGDNMPIHLDEDFARNVGLPGIIVHGLCTMAFTSWGVVQAVADGDSTRLARLAVRFSRPVLPGQTISTAIWSAGTVDDRARYGFETRNPDGEVVIKDGLAEVRPSPR